MSEVIKSYDDTCGRACEVRYDTARGARPYWVEARGAVKICATYRAQEEAEHAAAHFMATGDLPMAKNATRLRETGEPGSATPRFRAFRLREATPRQAEKPKYNILQL